MTQALLALLASAVFAGDEGKLYPLAADVVVDGMIIVADAPSEHGDASIDVVWEAAGRRFIFSEPARSGQHAYDPRSQPSWRGRAAIVATNIKEHAELKYPSLADEIDIFLAPEHLQPSTVNLLQGHRLLDGSWDRLLLLLAVVSALALVALTRRPALALLAGFAIAWVALDVRTMCDHAATISTVEKQGGRMPVLADAIAFAEQAVARIGSGSWSLDPSLDTDLLAAHYFGYAFAEKRRDAANADFVIARAPGQGEVIHAQGPYVLIQRLAP